jgi:hypothetical protein
MRGASAASHVTGTKKGIIEYERVSRGVSYGDGNPLCSKTEEKKKRR